ncbi:Ig-like domain-containing protein [Thomasclavelia cocleata]|uniref:Ig-like domain-containing protein n=1 Tax=Thomasclavelia cocleata TaxID=69824 RepID=UPI0025891CC8|nr:Ig-like domain-containing protein [Thomasclavelia cocleata]
MRRKKLLVIVVMLSFLLGGNTSLIYNVMAENLDDYRDTTEAKETLPDDEEVTTVDEEGNIRNLTQVEENMPQSIHNDFDIQSRSMSRISNSSIAVVNFRTKGSEKENTEYVEEGTGRSGYTNGFYAADGAFLGYDNESNPTKVKFMQAGVVGWVNASEVEVLNYTDSKVETLSKYYVKSGRLYHGISTKLSNTVYSSNLDVGKAPSYLKEGFDYYSYDGHYFYEGSSLASFTTMINDYKNNVRSNSINSNLPYYNYYQYLSHRSKTVYSADELNSAISKFAPTSKVSKMLNLGSSFISNQNMYGTNALLMIGVAANESSWGTSNIANTKNNLFGHGAVDSNPLYGANGYSSPEQSVYYHSAIFISKGYLDPVTDSRYYGANLGDKASGICVKYASDPYWGEKAASICWKIDAYLGSKDSGRYTIGIKDTISTNHSVIDIMSDSSSLSNRLYSTYPISSKTSNKKNAPSNYSFIILEGGDKNNYYKIQSDGAVNSSRTGIIQNPSQSEYNFDKDYGYIPKTSIKIVINGSNSNNPNDDKNTSNVIGESSGKEPTEPTISYSANSQSVGWLNEVTEPNTAGTTGRSLDLYQLKINLKNISSSVLLFGKVYSNGSWLSYSRINSTTIMGNSNTALQKVNFTLNNLSGYKLQYRVHSADIGWQNWIDQGNDAGTIGKNIQAIDFRLIHGSSVKNEPIAYYQAHVEEKGWLNCVGNSEIAGTEGEMLGLEAFKIGIENLSNYQLTVKTYDNTNKWITKNNVTSDTINGSIGNSIPLQAINLTLNNTDGYEIEYRTHLSNLGWSEWTSQGQTSGVTSGNNQIEAIMFRIVKTKYPTTIALNKTTLTINVKESETLKAILTPTNVENKNVTWYSSDPKVATVDNNGKVTGIAAGTATITVRTGNGKTASCNVTVIKQNPSVNYQTHVQDYGWQDSVKDGKEAGTTDQSKRLEAIKISISNNSSYTGSIQYQTHIQDIGWQEWKGNGILSGTESQSKRLEAIRIKLTGDLEKDYDIYYQVHAQEFGWLDWAKNGEPAGTAGYSYRLEAIKIKLVQKDKAAPGETKKPYIQRYVSYATHIQDIGWQTAKYDGEMSGTSGKSKRLEAINISLSNQLYSGSIEYKTHVQDYGWQEWKSNGQTAGTAGKSKRLEAIQIKLTGEMANYYDIYYRVHVQDYGWLGWAKNGGKAGSEGMSKRLEGIEIVLVTKGGMAPGSTSSSFIKK